MIFKYFHNQVFIKILFFCIFSLMIVSCSQNKVLKKEAVHSEKIKPVVSMDPSKFDKIKYDLVTALTNNKFKTVEKLLSKLNKNYDIFNISQKCDYHYFYGCYLYGKSEIVQAEEEFTNCLMINESYIQALISRAKIRQVFLKNNDESFQDYQRVLDILDYAKENSKFKKNSVITVYTISENKRIFDSYFNNKTDSLISKESTDYLWIHNNIFCSKSMTPDELRIECLESMQSIKYIEKDYFGAIEITRKLLDFRPENYEYLRKTGNYYFELQYYQDAVEWLNKYISASDYIYNYGIYYKKGLCYYHLDDYTEAINEFSNALNTLHFYQSKADSLTKKFQSERKHFLFYQDYPGKTSNTWKIYDENILLYRGQCYGKIKDYEKGIQDLSEVIKLNDKNDTAHYYRGYFNNYSGRKELALRDFMRALELNPGFKQLYYSIALIYDTQKKYEIALIYYQDYVNKIEDKKNKKYIIAKERIKKLKQH